MINPFKINDRVTHPYHGEGSVLGVFDEYVWVNPDASDPMTWTCDQWKKVVPKLVAGKTYTHNSDSKEEEPTVYTCLYANDDIALLRWVSSYSGNTSHSTEPQEAAENYTEV